MYLNDVWYCVALGTEITRKPLRRIICSEPVVMYRTENGSIVALEDRCSHRQVPLSTGRLVGDQIQCMYHGFTFNTDGVCTHVPHQNAPKSAAIRAYPVEERWGYIWLWRGDKAAADSGKIPTLPWTQSPEFRSVYFYWHVKSNFQIGADNLLDESHTDFLHRSSIGTETGMEGDEGHATVKCHIDGDQVHCVRKVENAKLSPVAAKWAGSELPLTRSNTQKWEAPNTVHMLMRFHETGRAVHMEHIFTPETESTCHYFMNWTRNFTLGNDAYPTDQDIIDAHRIVPDEDMFMMEAQQENLKWFKNPADVAAKADVFVVNAHRVLAGMHKRAGNPIPSEVGRDINVSL